jgi:acetyltransferase-like isoleucine patch superfamily enzyme
MIYKNARIGKNVVIQDEVFIGIPSRKFLHTDEDTWPETIIGDNGVLRSGTKIYCAVHIGTDFQTGHNVMIREDVVIGNKVLIGTNSVIDNACTIGSNVSIQSMVYIPTNTIIKDNVFIGPNVVMTNDKYPVRIRAELVGPVIEKGVSIGANVTILPGITIGEGSMIAAGSIVSRNVPAWKLAVGCPVSIRDIPDDLKIINMI